MDTNELEQKLASCSINEQEYDDLLDEETAELINGYYKEICSVFSLDDIEEITFMN